MKRLLFNFLKQYSFVVKAKRMLLDRRQPIKIAYASTRGQAPEPKRLIAAEESKAPDTFALYRIIGNDLYPRHKKGQSRENLSFILKNEASFENCEKLFIVNRIADKEEEKEIVELLENSDANYTVIPFELNQYYKHGWDLDSIPSEYYIVSKRHSELKEDEQSHVMNTTYNNKNRYVMNNNGARNIALKEGQEKAKWVLPWDGNCFITPAAWNDIVRSIQKNSHCKYLITPMARVLDNSLLLNNDAQFEANEEPQIIFRHDAVESFDETYVYGRRPKVELLWRLGVPGPWDSWPIEPWDFECPPFSPEAGRWAYAGWVARLFSGQAHQENPKNGLVVRGVARQNAIAAFLDNLDLKGIQQSDDKLSEVSAHLGQDWHRALQLSVQEALGRGPFSVVDKTTLPPSADAHDYWHPAPYYWPTLPGLPYMPRDGKRVPGTRMYEPESDRYDRTRLQRLFDDVYVLAMESILHGNSQAEQHALRLIKHWFINTDTAMNPHMKYAQVRPGWDGNQGSSSGIIEAKDVYFFLDAARWLVTRNVLKGDDLEAFTTWFTEYLQWLMTSPQGQKERKSANNHGTYYDLQVASIAHFLKDETLARQTFRDSYYRLMNQFTPDGQQPHELKRTTTAHYCCFNLQGWVHLAELASVYDEDLWHFTGPQGQGLKVAFEWLLAHDPEAWPYQQINAFDTQRFLPLRCIYQKVYDQAPDDALIEAYKESKPVFHPHDGIRPFWQLAALSTTALKQNAIPNA